MSKNKQLATLVNASRHGHTRFQRKPINRIIMVLDESGSMNHIREQAAKSFGQQVDSLKSAAKANQQEVEIMTICIDGIVKKPVADFNINSYLPDGSTPLWDGIGKAIAIGTKDLQDYDALLINVITDGAENSSKKFDQNSIATLITKTLEKDNISIVGCVPPRCKSYLTDIGVPAENVTEWETDAAGITDLTNRAHVGSQSYMSSRAAGKSVRSSAGAYMADMNRVSVNDANRMNDVSGDFKRFRVAHTDNKTEIADFIRSKGLSFNVGRAYYELSKPEEVSAKKGLLVLDKKTGAVYEGNQARTRLGLPFGVDIKLKPGMNGEFTLFIQSTSYNRHLAGGTTLLYRTN